MGVSEHEIYASNGLLIGLMTINHLILVFLPHSHRQTRYLVASFCSLVLKYNSIYIYIYIYLYIYNIHYIYIYTYTLLIHIYIYTPLYANVYIEYVCTFRYIYIYVYTSIPVHQ